MLSWMRTVILHPMGPLSHVTTGGKIKKEQEPLERSLFQFLQMPCSPIIPADMMSTFILIDKTAGHSKQDMPCENRSRTPNLENTSENLAGISNGWVSHVLQKTKGKSRSDKEVLLVYPLMPAQWDILGTQVI